MRRSEGGKHGVRVLTERHTAAGQPQPGPNEQTIYGSRIRRERRSGSTDEEGACMNARNEKRVVKTWSRASTVLPDSSGKRSRAQREQVHPVLRDENMVGHKLGEFARHGCSADQGNRRPGQEDARSGGVAPREGK